MRYAVTIFGLSAALLATGCDPKDKTSAAEVAKARPRVEDSTCGDPAQVPGEAEWLAQLPPIIKFRFETKKHEGVVAKPVCVRDRAHTSDWDDVVSRTGFFGEGLEVSYGRSLHQLVDTQRYAKLQVLTLEHHGRSWSGKTKEVLKRDGIWDGILETFLPIENDLTLPECTDQEMDTPAEVPPPFTPACT